MKSRSGGATGASARAIAARVIERVERERAFAAAVLDAELAQNLQLDPRDRALATELAYGVLRTRAVLEQRLARFARRGLGGTDRTVLAHLLVAAYQLLLLDRIPPFAAVDEAVALVRKARGQRVAGFANALLRKLAASGARLARDRAVRESAPGWLVAALEHDVGVEETTLLLGADGARPPVSVRVPAGKQAPGWLDDAPRGRASPLARLIESGGDLRDKPGWSDGAFVIQEEGAQVVALALGAQPGDRVLDACAGRGQKTTLLVERIGTDGDLWATDIHPHKLTALIAEHERLGLRPPQTAAVDWSRGAGEVVGSFDRVLVDAPCSGTGTLRRRPEIAARLEPDDPPRLAELAASILRNAAAVTRPGGRLVFAVCSVLAAEGERAAEAARDLLEPTPFDAPEARALIGDGASSFRLLPGAHGTDGYFVASFRRRH